MITRRNLFKAGIVASMAGLVTKWKSRAMTNTPNIVLIILDDGGIGDLSPYNSIVNYTPNIGDLANESTLYTRMYTPSPVCSPSRFAIMTGQYPISYGITKNIESKISLCPDYTLAERLQQNGYKTGMIGKWHLGAGGPDWLAADEDKPENNGFDVADNMRPFPLSPHLTHSDRQLDTQRWTLSALDFIRNIPNSAPFFLCVGYNAPHVPHFPMNEDDTGQGYYADAMKEVDAGIGQIREAIERRDQWDNTLFIVLADHGYSQANFVDPITGESRFYPSPNLASWNYPPYDNGNMLRYDRGRGFDNTLGYTFRECDRDAAGNRLNRTAKGSLYEGGIRIPCIIKWPSFAVMPAMDDQLRMTLDIYATIEQMVMGAISPQLEGSDLQGDPHTRIFATHKGNLAIIEDRWKYHTETGALYDLDASTEETDNVAGQYPNVVNRLTGNGQAIYMPTIFRSPVSN